MYYAASAQRLIFSGHLTLNESSVRWRQESSAGSEAEAKWCAVYSIFGTCIIDPETYLQDIHNVNRDPIDRIDLKRLIIVTQSDSRGFSIEISI